jgi:hypothetical protein
MATFGEVAYSYSISHYPMRETPMKFLVAGILLFACIAPALAKPRPVVQVLATGSDPSGMIEYLFLILPDGSHAEANCGMITCRLGLESFHPEKRKTFRCLPDGSTYSLINCLTIPESFYSDRKGNDLIIYGGSGAKVYHISGTWEKLEAVGASLK